MCRRRRSSSPVTLGTALTLLMAAVNEAAYSPSVAVDLRVCYIVNLKHDSLELMRATARYWQTLGVAPENLNYVLASKNAHHNVVAETRAKLEALGIPAQNHFVQPDTFSVARQYGWFRNCSEEALRRRPPAEGAVPWLSWMDADELPVFPLQDTSNFPAMLANLEARGIHLYAGVMTDRVSPDGSLVAVNGGENTTSLFEQFPVRCSLTKNIIMGTSTKAIAFDAECLDDSGGCRFTPGHDGAHHLDNFQGFRCQPRQEWGELAHFKWTDDVLSKLCWRTRKHAIVSGKFNATAVAPPGQDEIAFWHRESENMMHFLLQDDMKIDVDSSLCARQQNRTHVKRGDGRVFDVTAVYDYVGLPKWQVDGHPCEPKVETRPSSPSSSLRLKTDIGGPDPDDSRSIVTEEDALQNFLQLCANEKYLKG